MRVGIVGHEAAKFTPETEEAAREIIRFLLRDPYTILVSGHCPLGGIDIWAEEEAQALDREMVIFPPKCNSWEGGYKPRNEAIAETSDVVNCIVVSSYPPGYKGMQFDRCYHCHTNDHIKSGGCWTAKRARKSEWFVL